MTVWLVFEGPTVVAVFSSCNRAHLWAKSNLKKFQVQGWELDDVGGSPWIPSTS